MQLHRGGAGSSFFAWYTAGAECGRVTPTAMLAGTAFPCRLRIGKVDPTHQQARRSVAAGAKLSDAAMMVRLEIFYTRHMR